MLTNIYVNSKGKTIARIYNKDFKCENLQTAARMKKDGFHLTMQIVIPRELQMAYQRMKWQQEEQDECGE